MAQEGIAPTESQLAAMGRAREEMEARGETKTEHPGYLGAQDTYYVRKHQGRWAHLPADLHRHLRESGVLQAARLEERACGGGRA